MKPVSELSDFEINKRVSKAIGLQVQEIDDSKKTGMTTWYHEHMPNTVWVSNGEEPWYQYAPCNSAEDAWPIIAANKITIEWRDALKLPPCAKRSGDTRLWVADENPLRAAMCVFLMMQGASHE